MAKTASLKKTSRSGLRSVPNPLADAAGSLGAEVVAIEQNQRIIVPLTSLGPDRGGRGGAPELVLTRAHGLC
jgi:hypothetical protein